MLEHWQNLACSHFNSAILLHKKICLCVCLLSIIYVGAYICVYGYMDMHIHKCVHDTMCVCLHVYHDDVMKWKQFPRYWPLWGEFIGHLWIPLTKARDAELWCFLWSAPEQTIDLRRHRAHYEVTVIYIFSVGCDLDTGVAWCRQATSHYLS